MQKLVSRAKFAELAGVNPSTVTRISKTLLKAAVVGKQLDLDHPDVKHYLEDKIARASEPAVPGLDPLYERAYAHCLETGKFAQVPLARYLRVDEGRAKKLLEMMRTLGVIPAKGERTKKPVGAAAFKEMKKAAPPPQEEPIEVPDAVSAFADWTVRDVVTKFGTDARFLDYLKALQTIEAIEEKRLKNEVSRGKLISKTVVKDLMLDRIEAMFIRMLTDSVKTISSRAYAIVKADGQLNELNDMVEDQLGSVIRPVKAKLSKALRNA